MGSQLLVARHTHTHTSTRMDDMTKENRMAAAVLLDNAGEIGDQDWNPRPEGSRSGAHLGKRKIMAESSSTEAIVVLRYSSGSMLSTKAAFTFISISISNSFDCNPHRTPC